jgi:hypothetical protein
VQTPGRGGGAGEARQHTEWTGPQYPTTDHSFRLSDGKRGHGERDGRSTGQGSRFLELGGLRRQRGRIPELEGILVRESIDITDRQRRGASVQPRGHKTVAARPGHTTCPARAHPCRTRAYQGLPMAEEQWTSGWWQHDSRGEA